MFGNEYGFFVEDAGTVPVNSRVELVGCLTHVLFFTLEAVYDVLRLAGKLVTDREGVGVLSVRFKCRCG